MPKEINFVIAWFWGKWFDSAGDIIIDAKWIFQYI